MRPLKRITTRAVPLIIDDVDTDMIFPAQFATTVGASGFGECLFARERYGPDGQTNGTFPLDRAEYRGAEILVSGANFGCGSSREHAVWALRDFGFRCIIAESFADIFYSNCFRNGVLPVPLARDVITNLADRIQRDPSWLITIDLETQTVEGHDESPVSFAVEPFGRKMLLEGLDEISLTLEDEPDIALFEDAHVASQPWLRNRKI